MSHERPGTLWTASAESRITPAAIGIVQETSVPKERLARQIFAVALAPNMGFETCAMS